jgi:hypothetical protein
LSCVRISIAVYLMQRVSPRHSVGAVVGKKDIPFYFEMVFYFPLVD